MNGWEVLPVEGVEVLYSWNGWEVQASWPGRGSRHEIVTQIRVDYKGMNPKLVMSTKRINLLSTSALTGIVSAMKKAVPADDVEQYSEFMHNVAEDLIGWYRQGKGISRPDPTKVTGNGGWMLYPLWPATGITAVAAAPGSFKSFLAQGIGLSVATESEVLTANTRLRAQREVLYLDWEADEGTFAERLGALCRGADIEVAPHLGYKKMEARLTDVAIPLAEEIAKEKYGAVIVDSMSAAIGGGMVDDDQVNGFYDAVRQLRVPALVIAHKSADNIAKRKARFFGSMMSEARVRMAWNAEKAEDLPMVKWQCFKDNNTGKIGAELAWELDFQSAGEREEERLDRITVHGVNPRNVLLEAEATERSQLTVADEIEEVLHQVGGGMTVAQIAAKVRKSSNNVRAQLSRHTDRFAKDQHDRWWPRTPGKVDPAQTYIE